MVVWVVVNSEPGLESRFMDLVDGKAGTKGSLPYRLVKHCLPSCFGSWKQVQRVSSI